MSHPARHRDHELARKRAVRAASLTVAVVALAVILGSLFAYRQLNGNITGLDTEGLLGSDRPEKVVDESEPLEPLNILLLGSDTREGLGNSSIGGDTPGLSDTTILLHLSADRKRAYGVSLPRDAMVERPECVTEDGGTDPGGLSMFNAAYAAGGPACTQRTVEQLTGIHIDHFVVVDFAGFKSMVDALGGVEVCVPEEVNDDVGNIHLPEGTYEVTGKQALDYVRVRHGISENGDIGRMRRQQAFLASMANKAISAGTLANPVKLYNFLDAATNSLTTDEELASLKELAGLANQVRGIGLENIQFLTVPWEWWPEDRNRVVWAPEADKLWHRLENDLELPRDLSKGVLTAADKPDAKPKPSGGVTPSQGPAESPTPTPSDEAAAAEAAENGLCA
ncbi:MAG TPA: LCP family protein [Nocardioidaceae bacterium]|nr:LCP family protein [Nocardioidaceae bacterium]